jgi:hypothetical protein
LFSDRVVLFASDPNATKGGGRRDVAHTGKQKPFICLEAQGVEKQGISAGPVGRGGGHAKAGGYAGLGQLVFLDVVVAQVGKVALLIKGVVGNEFLPEFRGSEVLLSSS